MRQSLNVALLLGALLGTSSALADFYSDMQWGLSNLGSPQNIDLDPVKTYRVQARVGEDIRLPKNLKKIGKKILVAVLDTGIDHDHPDLRNNIHRNESECRALEKFLKCTQENDRKVCEKTWFDLNNPEVDLDKNGYPLDCSGWSILGNVNAAGILGSPDFSDDQGHGTHVAGVIAAERDNGLGIDGVSGNIEILPVQVLGVKPNEPLKPLSFSPVTNSQDVLSPTEEGKEGSRGTLADLVARGVIYAIRSGAQVINFSMGWPESNDSELLRKVIQEAQRRGIIVVAAAGNDSTKALLKPCAYPGVICVGSHGPDGAISHFSNYGSGVDLVAPGANILSTYPQDLRSVRFRNEIGYEFVNGTSQATPFVTGVVAEMLAQGIPRDEIYPRLVASARQTQKALPLLSGGTAHLKPDPRKPLPVVEEKYVLSGLLDTEGAFKAKPQPVILPASKDKKEIRWDRQNSTLKVSFDFKNYWQDLDFSQLQTSVTNVKVSLESVRPRIAEVKWSHADKIWKQDEVRELELTLQIEDTRNPEDSRIPSELDFEVTLIALGKTQKVIQQAEVIVPVGPSFKVREMETLGLVGLPPMRLSFVSIDQNYDQSPLIDYVAYATKDLVRTYYLLTQKGSNYEAQSAGFEVKFLSAKDMSNSRVNFSRIDINGDGISEYVIGVYIDRSFYTEETARSEHRMHVLDSQFHLIRTLSIKGEKAQPPIKVYWQKVGAELRPTWIGRGYATSSKPSLIDDWENPEGYERSQIRLYYLGKDGELKSISEFSGYKITDILEPDLNQMKTGQLQILMAKDLGTELKPSYIYDFAIADLSNEKIQNLQSLTDSLMKHNYRNLIDTRVDRVMSLDKYEELGKGTFWFSEGPDRSQRLSLLTREAGEFQFMDANLSAGRGSTDAALWVRASFAGKNEAGAFALTNSEIQYHDIFQEKILARSLERYTFYNDLAFTNLQFPVTLLDQKRGGQIPALFTIENVGFSKGVRFHAAVRSEKTGELVEILSPAKLRLQSDTGCRPLDNPTKTADGNPALDYYCGNKILRVKLSY